MVQVSPSMRGIEEKGQSPADNRGLTLFVLGTWVMYVIIVLLF